MSQRHSDNTKRPQPKEIQLGILKLYVFCQKIKQKALGPRESTAGVTNLSVRIHPKSCHISPLKVTATLLSGSRKGAIGA